MSADGNKLELPAFRHPDDPDLRHRLGGFGGAGDCRQSAAADLRYHRVYLPGGNADPQNYVALAPGRCAPAPQKNGRMCAAMRPFPLWRFN